MQPLTNAYNAHVHCFTNLTPFILGQSRQAISTATFDALTASPTNPKAATFPYLLQPWLLHCIAILRQNFWNQMKTAPRRYRGDYDKVVGNLPQAFYAGQYTYIDLSK